MFNSYYVLFYEIIKSPAEESQAGSSGVSTNGIVAGNNNADTSTINEASTIAYEMGYNTHNSPQINDEYGYSTGQ